MLNKQAYELVFTAGVDLKTDPKLVLPAKLLNLENGVFIKGGTIQKRYGYSFYKSYYKTMTGTLAIPFDLTPTSLSSYQDELLMSTNNTLLSYGQEADYWIEKSVISPFIITYDTIVNDSLTKTYADMAINESIEVYAYQDTGGLKCTVLDTNTKTVYQYSTLISATGSSARVVNVGDSIFIIYINNVTGTYSIKAAKIDKNNPNNIAATYTIGSNNSDGHLLDATVCGNNAVVVWSKGTSNHIMLSLVSQSGVVSSGGSVYVPPQLEITYDALTVLTVLYNSTSQNIWIAAGNSTDGIKVCVYKALAVFTPVLALTAVDAYITEALTNITGEFISSTQARFFYEYVTPAASVFGFKWIKTNTLTEAGVVGTPAVFKRNVGLATKAFNHNDNIFVTVTYESPPLTSKTLYLDDLQPSYFVLDSSGNVRGKILSQKGAGLVPHPLHSISSIGEKYYCAAGQSLRLESDSTSVVRSVDGVAKVEIDFDSSYLNFGKEINDIFYFTGGQVEVYDGEHCVEAGFHTFPEGMTSSTANVGGFVEDGTHLYKAVWTWRDRRGNLHRSAPSYSISRASAGGVADRSVNTINIPSLTLTNKLDVLCEIYRNVLLGSTFYKVGSVANNPAVEYISFADTLADATIENQELLYTLGGELENIAPPSSRLLDVWQNRIFVVTDDERLWYTKERADNIAMEFNDFGFTKYIHPDGGKTTAITALDTNLIVFKQERIYFINGTGANSFGLNGNLSEMQLITTDVGCIDPNSVVICPNGLLFKTQKGIYLLTRGLTVEYKGSPVESYNSNTVLSAVLHQNFNEVRFLLDNNKVLVWNYFFDQWSVFTNILGIDSVVFNDKYVYLKDSGVVAWEDTSKFTDGLVPIQLKIETAWVKTGGIQGFQRIYWAHLLGDYLSAHDLQLTLSYDYSESKQSTITWTPDTVLATTHYGDDTPYGETGSVYGGDSDGVYQFRTKPRIQKCESIKFTIYDTHSTGRGYSLSHLLLTVGIKGSNYKLRKNKTI